MYSRSCVYRGDDDPMSTVHIEVREMGFLPYDSINGDTYRGLTDFGGLLTFQDPNWDSMLDFLKESDKSPVKDKSKLDAYEKWGGWYKNYYLNYNKRCVCFDSGLLQEVISYLEQRGYTVITTDNRVKIKHFISDTNTYTLWKVQQNAVRSLLQQHNGLCCLPCGCGKTLIMCELIRRLGMNAIILCHRTDIMYSNKEKFELSFPNYNGHVGVIGDSQYDLQPISVGTIQTFSYHLKQTGKYRSFKKITGGLGRRKAGKITDEVFNYFSIVMVDECHHIPCEMFLNTIRNFNSYYKFGFTATPYRIDNLWRFVPTSLGGIRIQRSISDMTKLKKIVPARIKVLKGRKYHNGLSWRGVIDELSEDTERNRIIGREIEGYPTPCLILTGEVDHLDYMSDTFVDMGIDAITVVGSKKKGRNKRDHLPKWRKEVIDRMRIGEIDYCIATPIFDEGIDIPEICSLVLAMPFNNWKSVEQRIGRGLRRGWMKPYLVVLDLKDENKILNRWYASRRQCYRKESAWTLKEMF